MTVQFQFSFEWMLLAGALVGLILVGGLVIGGVKRWQGAQKTPAPPTRVEDYRALMEQGLIDPREFERIRDHLEKGHAKNQVDKITPPVTPPAEPPVN